MNFSLGKNRELQLKSKNVGRSRSGQPTFLGFKVTYAYSLLKIKLFSGFHITAKRCNYLSILLVRRE